MVTENSQNCLKEPRKDAENKDEMRNVTFTVTITEAFPKANRDTPRRPKSKQQREPVPQGYYHHQYTLFPSDEHPIKTDVISFGVAAKVFCRRYEPVVVKTWEDQGLLWITWSENHTVNVTDELLEKLTNHRLELRIWDIRDKVAPKARFDRPKTFRLLGLKSADDEGTEDLTRELVLQQTSEYERTQPKSVNRGSLSVSGEDTGVQEEGKVAGGPSRDSELEKSTPPKLPRIQLQLPSANARSPRSGRGVESPKHSDEVTLPAAETSERSTSSAAGNVLDGEKNEEAEKTEAEALERAKQIKQDGICCIHIKMAKFFSEDVHSQTARLASPLVSLHDAYVTVSLDVPLMSDAQRRRLNPLLLHVQYAADMPSTPVNYADLRLQCCPTFVRYSIFKLPDYISEGTPQGRHVPFDDVRVILTGPMDPSALLECLQGAPLEIEVHDRDRLKREPEDSLVPALFGKNSADTSIADVHASSDSMVLPKEPHGVAKFDLSELLLGHRVLHLKSPVLRCHTQEESNSRVNTSDCGMPLPAGHYLEHGSTLKLLVQITRPLVPDATAGADKRLQCPFARIVLRCSHTNVQFVCRLRKLLTEGNACALNLAHFSAHVREAALSTYKLSHSQQRDPTLDVVTGFHIMDGEMHLFVLEGIGDKGVKQLWQAMPIPDAPDVGVVYHSGMSFSERLYGSLHVDVERIQLYDTLREIVQRPLLYVRDILPRPCFQAVIKLVELCRQTNLRDVVRNELFPTAQMVASLSKELGVPLTGTHDEEFHREVRLPDQEPVESTRAHAGRRWAPLETQNAQFEQSLKERTNHTTTTDFMAENKDSIRRQSELNSEQRSMKTPAIIRADASTAHNYSTQTLNSTQLANVKLRAELAKGRCEMDTQMRFWRCATRTEMTNKGPKSSNQIERLKGLLKDPPSKLAYTKLGVSVPSLSVLWNSSEDTGARLPDHHTTHDRATRPPKKMAGFIPGPDEHRRWSSPGNHIPTSDQRTVFHNVKSADFNVYHKQHQPLYKRPVPPLKVEEHGAEMFQMRAHSGKGTNTEKSLFA